MGPPLKPLLRRAKAAPRDATIQLDLGVALLGLGEPTAALRHLDRAVSLDPAFGAAHFQRGVALELCQAGAAAAEAYERAIETGFETAALCSRLAALWHQSGRRDGAAPLYRHAASMAPGTLGALRNGARAALIEGDLEEAENLIRHVLARKHDDAGLRADLAYILRARGDFAAATAELEHALRDEPRIVGLLYELVQNGRVSDPALVARIRAAMATPGSPRLTLHLALAKALDDLGDYAAARIELEAADTLREAGQKIDRAAMAAQTDRIIGLFTPHYMAHKHHAGSAAELPILVLGMPRSGTTLVEQILASHSAVRGAGELNFWEMQGRAFLDAADPSLGADLRAVADAYVAKLRTAAPGAARVVDKMPFNFRWAPLIHLALPRARIIHCRRHPADTCLSIMATNMPSTPTFSAARDDLVFFYRQYLRLVAHGRAVVPASCWLDVDYEALVEAPEPSIRAMLEFCGLAWEPACLTPERTVRTVRTFSQWQARQPIYGGSSGRWRQYGAWLRDFEVLQEAAVLF